MLIGDLVHLVTSLKEYFPKHTDFEAIQIAGKVDQANPFKKAFMVSNDQESTTPVFPASE